RSVSSTDDPALAAALGNTDEPIRIRAEAALAMGGIADASAVPSLVAVLGRERSHSGGGGGGDAEQLRIAVVQALGSIGGARAHAALEEHARENLSPTERAFTRRALAGPSAARPPGSANVVAD